MIETLANWGEFLGGVAVVISLIYVGIQVRSSVRQAKLDSYAKTTELWAHFTSNVAANNDTWDFFYNGTHDYKSLKPSERSRFNFLISMYFGLIEHIMSREEAGQTFNDDTYERNLDQAFAVFMMPGVQAWFEKAQGRIFSPSIEKYLIARRDAEIPKV